MQRASFLIPILPLRWRTVLVILGMCGRSIAQDPQHFVEVIVEDTIHLPIRSITVLVGIVEEEDDFHPFGSEQERPEPVSEAERAKKLKELEVQLTKAGFGCRIPTEAEQLLGFHPESIGPRDVEVTVGTLAELERLYALCKSIPRCGVGMKEVGYAPHAEYADQLLGRLNARARKEAAAMAHAGAMELGPLLEVADVSDPQENSILSRLMRTDEAKPWTEQWRAALAVYRRSMRFRFQLVH